MKKLARSATAGLIAFLPVIACATLSAAPAAATFPGNNGRITFMRADQNDTWQVWVANADLTDQHQLTSDAAYSGWSTWKPDGTRIAFESGRSDPDPSDDVGINDVFTMSPDGTHVVQVTDLGGVSGDPSWSPDGKLLTFESDLGDYPAKEGIFVSHADGKASRCSAPSAGTPSTSTLEHWPHTWTRWSTRGSRLRSLSTRLAGSVRARSARSCSVGSLTARRCRPPRTWSGSRSRGAPTPRATSTT
jgi:Tol biopolymer transport system component